MTLSEPVQALAREYFSSLDLKADPTPYREGMRSDSRLPAIYSPAAAYDAGGEKHVLFMAGEYDKDDARLLSVIAKYKARVAPVCRAVFLNVDKAGAPVVWLGQANLGAALVAAVYDVSLEHSASPAGLAAALLGSLKTLLGLSPARMGEGLAQIDGVLSSHLLPIWNLSESGRDLIRPFCRALNHLLRRALDDALPPQEEISSEPLLSERVRLWKNGGLWYRFQSLEYVESMFRRREAGLYEVYKGLYALNQDPDAKVDRVRLRVLTEPAASDKPDAVPFAAGGAGCSSLRGEFLFARRTIIEQHGASAPDLVWAVAECPVCRSRSKFRKDASPLTIHRVSASMERVKQMLVGGKKMATFHCTTCGQPLGFDHLVLAAYGHYLADRDMDLHFLNEKRPGRRRTFIQTMAGNKVDCRSLPVTDKAVAEVVGRPLSAVGPWIELIKKTDTRPEYLEFAPGFFGLCLPPADPMKSNMQIGKFQDYLAAKRPGYWAVSIDLDLAGKRKLEKATSYPAWLGPLANKTSLESGYRVVGFVDMDLIEELFVKAAKKQGLDLKRALDGSMEVRGADLTLPVDLKRPVEEALLLGHFPGAFAVREAGRQARKVFAAEKVIGSIREYLGRDYMVRYNPTTNEVVVEGSGLPVGFPLDELLESWSVDSKKTRQSIIAKVG